MQHNAENKSLGVFIPALLMVILLTFASYNMDFEPGSTMNRILPLLPCVFAINFWLPRNLSWYFLTLSGVIASYLILDFINATGMLVTAVAFATIVQTSKLKPYVKILVCFLLLLILALFRTGLFSSPYFSYAAPVAGSMLMFRGILMLYEHHYSKFHITFQERAAYILLVPNFAFPLFPIVDYKLFLNNYNPSDIQTIRTGIRRILMGMLQLLLYRIIYIYILPLQSEILSSEDTLLFVLSSYLLVLHLTGLLWMATGFLGILGFNLPPVFNGIFLIENFRDIWRRVNIYWREFMMKIFYYPIYFKFRKKIRQAVLLSSAITLTVSTLLHGWQWFWLQGELTLQTTSVIYWLILGSCITYSLTRQQHETTKTIVTPGIPIFLLNTLHVFLMYLVMSGLWSLWSSSGLSEWWYFIKKLIPSNGSQLLNSCALLLVLYILLATGKWIYNRKIYFAQQQLFLWYLLLTVVLAISSDTRVQRLLPEVAQQFATSIFRPELNADDSNEATENYYSRMLSTEGNGRKPWEAILRRSEAKSGLDKACIIRNDMVVRELIPSRSTTLEGWSITTNTHGMRDQEYAQIHPPDRLRIAVLGGSYEMGSGVDRPNIFEYKLETMLKDSLPSTPCEILNFAVGGYHLPQQVWVLENKVAPFYPDAVLCFIHPSDARRNINFLAQLIKNGADLIYPELYNFKRRSGSEQKMSMMELKNRLNPYLQEITEWAMRRMETYCSKQGIHLTYVYLPALMTNENDYSRYHFEKRNSSRSALFPNVISLQNIYGPEPNKYGLTNDPSHPNAAGHELIATVLFTKLSPYIRAYKPPIKLLK